MIHGVPAKLPQHGGDLVRREHHGHPLRLRGTDYLLDPAHVLLEDLLRQQEQGAARLARRRGGDVPCHGEVRQELWHLLEAHGARMAFIVQEDAAVDPANVGFFGAQAVVPGPKGVADLLQPFGL
jgi:hypothetical protein